MKIRILITNLFFIAHVLLFMSSCDTESMKKVSMDKFVGTWELKGRSMLEGIKIEIKKTDSGSLVGKVVEINDNKYVKFFVEPNETWITNIKRSSNSQFRLTEKKIGSALFATYGLGTKKEFKVEFLNNDTIGLGSDSKDPEQSTIQYLRVK
ncbi:hypothetical protein DF185_12440 [Marinifilum breve]|uniref:Uncharacterized protein n=1 Tax=Marinifilum breve TaxID=2184082 RepID=A0A2V4A9R7_9BACT|nr:hypothetical protein [Marinifilum breve]PXY00714.1 hypothetical protein DF185_12440 [Marinifilum breve]